MKSERPCSQEQDTRPHPEPAEATPHSHALFLYDSPPTHAVSQVILSRLFDDVHFQLGLAYFPNYGRVWSEKNNINFW